MKIYTYEMMRKTKYGHRDKHKIRCTRSAAAPLREITIFTHIEDRFKCWGGKNHALQEINIATSKLNVSLKTIK